MRISAEIKRIFVSIFANFNANLATKIPKLSKKREKTLKCVKMCLKIHNNIRFRDFRDIRGRDIRDIRGRDLRGIREYSRPRYS